MHFDKHESQVAGGGGVGVAAVGGWQQMPHLLVLNFVLSHQMPGDPKTSIVYGLLLKNNVICRTDLTVTPGVSLFHSHVFWLCLYKLC